MDVLFDFLGVEHFQNLGTRFAEGDVTGVLQSFGAIMWGPMTWLLLGACGLYLSFKTNWFQITKFVYYCKHTLGSMFKKDATAETQKGDITPFQAFTSAMAATMGVGNLVGTTTAIIFGGPGAVFWMWIIGFFGITTKLAEITLAVHFRETTPAGHILGGPMKYIERGLGKKFKWLAVMFAVAGALAAFGIGNLAQINNVANAFETAFSMNRQITAAIVIVIVGVVIIGGVKRVGAVAEYLVPFFALIMIVGSLLVIFQNFDQIGHAFYLMVVGAFRFQSAAGGFVGAGVALAIRYGLMRGIFSNEAGLGSAPIAHAAAITDHPIKQGLWGAIEVVLDTHVVATVVALAVITSGAWTMEGMNATQVFMYSFSSSIIGEGLGNFFAAVSIAGFAITTMLGWSFYGEKCLEYITSAKSNLVYKILFLIVLFIGSYGIVPVWAVSDILNAFMAIPNIIAVILLTGIFTKILKSYFAGEKYVTYDEQNDYYLKKDQREKD